jgi:Flp pilus assembly protein TadG
MVEFAIATAALLLVIFGIVEFARFMYTYHAVANAARIGSRWAMVRGTQSCSTPTGKALATCPATEAEIQAYVQSVVPMDDSAALTVTANWTTGRGCSSSTDLHMPGCVVQVTASNPFGFAVPFVSNNILTVSSTSQMVISQ